MIGIYLTLIDNENDKIIFEKLYNAHREKLMGLAFSILNERSLAEDAVSETFFYVARNFGKLRGLTLEQLELYCSMAVKNISRNFIKGHSREMPVETVDIREDGYDFTLDGELKKLDTVFLEESISRLAYIDKEILLLYYFYSLSLKEIAKLKKISDHAAQKRLQLARKHLKKLLEEKDYAG